MGFCRFHLQAGFVYFSTIGGLRAKKVFKRKGYFFIRAPTAKRTKTKKNMNRCANNSKVFPRVLDWHKKLFTSWCLAHFDSHPYEFTFLEFRDERMMGLKLKIVYIFTNWPQHCTRDSSKRLYLPTHVRICVRALKMAEKQWRHFA
jgi:hypothetical protein